MTVIIPTHNRAGMLSRAIQSVQRQTYANWMLIVADNASNDSTSLVVEEAMRNDARILYYRHSENIGMLPNWEFGLSKVNSRFFCLLCDDDYVLPGFLQAAMKEMDRYPEIGLCFGIADVVDDEGKRRGQAPNEMETGFYEAGHGAAAMLKLQHPATPAVLFRTECLKSVGWFDQRSQFVADLDMIVRVALKYPIKFFDEVVACYVVHSGNSFQDVSGWFPGLLNVIRNIKKIKISDESHKIKIFESFSRNVIFQLLYQFIHQPTASYKSGIIMNAMKCLIETRQVGPTLLLLFSQEARDLRSRVSQVWVKALFLGYRIAKKINRLLVYTITALEPVVASVSTSRGALNSVEENPPFDTVQQPVVESFAVSTQVINRVEDNKPSYDQDGLRTEHCADFMKDERFLAAYAAGEATGSWGGVAIHWRVYIACWLAERSSHLEGDFIECGVNRGGMARAIVSYLGPKLKGRRFYLLDTYQGIPDYILSEREACHSQAFKNNYTECLHEVTNTFSPFPEVMIVQGLVPNTFHKVDSDQFCFVHVDMNNARSEIAAAEYLWPRLAVGGFMLLDDYGWQINIDQRTAFDRFALERGLTVLALPTGQGLLMKT